MESKDDEIAELEALLTAVDRRLRLVESDERKCRRRPRHRLEVHHKLICLGLLIAVTPFVLVAWVSRTYHAPVDPVGLRAPVFALPSVGGGAHYGTAQLRGKPAIIVFWTAGCAPCGEELRRLQKAWEDYRGDGLAVLGVQVRAAAGPDGVGTLVASGVTFPNVRDSSGVVAGSFGLMGVPEAYFIDAHGHIRVLDRGTAVGVDEHRGVVLWDAIPPSVLDHHVRGLLSYETQRRGHR